MKDNDRTIILPERCKVHPPGIYFDLPEDVYHADASLGSTDMKRLSQSPPDFWWRSRFNPANEDEEKKTTDAQLLGTAIHLGVLEGIERLRERFAPRDFSGSTKDGKAENAAIAMAGKIGMKRKDWERAQQVATYIRENPSISRSFSGGLGAEISIFWRDQYGIPKKARFDYTKPRAIVDLKTNANQYDEPFPASCRKYIARYHAQIQAAHYCEGREAARELVRTGRVINGPPLPEVKDVFSEPAYAWVWIFWQSTGAPLTWGTMLSPGNAILEYGQRQCEAASGTFIDFYERFEGLGNTWVISEPLQELPLEEMPGWYGQNS